MHASAKTFVLARKFCALALSVLLAIATCPAAAYASGLKADTTATKTSTQAKRTVYVLTSMKNKSFGQYNKFTYNKSGLLKKRVMSSGFKSNFTYNKQNNLSGCKDVEADGSLNAKVSFTVNKKGLITKVKGKKWSGKTNSTFTYKSGKLSKVKQEDGNGLRTYAYSYRNGKVSKIVYRDYGVERLRKPNNQSTMYYYYDDMGYVSSYASRDAGSSKLSKYQFTASYGKNGLPDKRVSEDGYNETRYTYKKVKVSSKLVAKIKAQQWALLNFPDLNMALGEFSLLM